MHSPVFPRALELFTRNGYSGHMSLLYLIKGSLVSQGKSNIVCHEKTHLHREDLLPHYGHDQRKVQKLQSSD